MYSELKKNPRISVHLLHQSGHIIPNRFEKYNDIGETNIEAAKGKFIELNPTYSYGTPSTEFIIYISKYNDTMDRTTRIALQEMRQREVQYYYTTPIHFRPLCYMNPNLLNRR